MATPNPGYAQNPEPVMKRIPEGWFEMGCDAGRDDEKPAHRVWVDSFELAAFQTTNAEYAQFLKETGRPAPLLWEDSNFSDPAQPVVAVSWFDAVAYCQWLSAKFGQHYRLPTEAEWERAARGGMEGETYPWGNAAPEELPDYANRWKSGPEPVGLYTPNAYALYNLSDNVHEWCADWYDANYYAVSPERNPQGPPTGSRRASRGGSWRHHIKVTRTAARSSIPPEFKYADYGFRIAANPRLQVGPSLGTNISDNDHVNPVIIRDYDLLWPQLFEMLRSRIAVALGDIADGIEHVGSTSVPGLAAKPIIDIDALLMSDSHLPLAISRLASIGYAYRGDLGVAGREAFRTPPGDCAHHLYVCLPSGAEHLRHVTFRDYLRTHQQDADRYAELKRALAIKFRGDRDAYNEGKSGFVDEVLRRAGESTSKS